MPKVKIPRKSTAIDMTAMCDVAFLLLTFFMLTSKFKPKDPVAVDIPASRAQIPIPESKIIMLTVDKTGAVYMGVDDQKTRLEWLNQIAAPVASNGFGLQFTAKQQDQFRLTDMFGCDITLLPQVLSIEGSERDKVQKGIPTDSINGRNQLEDMIFLARRAGQIVHNDAFRIIVKADRDADYQTVQKVIKILQDRKNNVNRFNLITSAKGAGGAPAQQAAH
jgi:biopolymer transport protein ExbD